MVLLTALIVALTVSLIPIANTGGDGFTITVEAPKSLTLKVGLASSISTFAIMDDIYIYTLQIYSNTMYYIVYNYMTGEKIISLTGTAPLKNGIPAVASINTENLYFIIRNNTDTGLLIVSKRGDNFTFITVNGMKMVSVYADDSGTYIAGTMNNYLVLTDLSYLYNFTTVENPYDITGNTTDIIVSTDKDHIYIVDRSRTIIRYNYTIAGVEPKQLLSIGDSIYVADSIRHGVRLVKIRQGSIEWGIEWYENTGMSRAEPLISLLGNETNPILVEKHNYYTFDSMPKAIVHIYGVSPNGESNLYFGFTDSNIVARNYMPPGHVTRPTIMYSGHFIKGYEQGSPYDNAEIIVISLKEKSVSTSSISIDISPSDPKNVLVAINNIVSSSSIQATAYNSTELRAEPTGTKSITVRLMKDKAMFLEPVFVKNKGISLVVGSGDIAFYLGRPVGQLISTRVGTVFSTARVVEKHETSKKIVIVLEEKGTIVIPNSKYIEKIVVDGNEVPINRSSPFTVVDPVTVEIYVHTLGVNPMPEPSILPATVLLATLTYIIARYRKK